MTVLASPSMYDWNALLSPEQSNSPKKIIAFNKSAKMIIKSLWGYFLIVLSVNYAYLLSPPIFANGKVANFHQNLPKCKSWPGIWHLPAITKVVNMG
jgi:hypothetical protein